MGTQRDIGRAPWAFWLSALTVAVGMAALLVVLIWPGQPAQANGNGCEIKGTVLTSPGTPTGMGTWQVQGTLSDCDGANGSGIYTVRATETTRFPDGLPEVQDLVEVKGDLVASQTLDAWEIEREDSEEDPSEVEFHGWVESRPTRVDGIGTWSIRLSAAQAETVEVDGNTRFKHGVVPEVGQWVEVEGTRQADGTVLASRIRLDDYEANQVVVRLKEGVTPGTLASRRNLVLLRSLLPSANIHLFASQDDEENLVQILTTQDKDLVIWAELNYVGGIPEGDPYDIWEWGGEDRSGYVNQAAFQQVHLPDPLTTVNGQGITVAVVDTGIALGHPELQNRVVSGWDMVDDDAVPNDEPGGGGWGHGTHVAGIIARMAPGSTLMPIRVLDPQGRGNSFVVAYAVEWAVNQGAQVINLSLGGPFDSQVLREAVAWATQQGVIVVAAAGNRASNAPQYPAAYPEVVAVTAVDAANQKADFANYGSWVDLAAPGVGITSTLVSQVGYGYASWSGTSMATAFVSGAAALGRQQDPSSPAPRLAQELRSTAERLDGANPTYAGDLGGGLLHVARFLGIPETTPTPTPTPSPSPSPTPTPTPTPQPTPVPARPLYLPLVLQGP